ncbi:MAG: S8 family serine peptidase, partial [Thermoplasmata archaeon]
MTESSQSWLPVRAFLLSFLLLTSAVMIVYSSSGDIDEKVEVPLDQGVREILTAVGNEEVMGFATEPWETGTRRVAVMTTRLDTLLDFLSENKILTDRPGSIGNSHELSVKILEVPASLISEIEGLEGVVGVSEYAEPSPPMGSGGDTPAPSLEIVNERHGIDSARGKGFTGKNVKIAIPDYGVDFANLDLLGTQARDTSTFSTTDESVVDSAVDGQDNATLPHRRIIPGTENLFLNGTPMSGYSIDHETGHITFSPALSTGDVVTASYDYYSPYYGWPIVYDPMSVSTYMSTKYPDDTWFVNATQNGTDLFPVRHRIRIDGKNDFADQEMWGSDDEGEVKYQPPFGGQTTDFDLKDLYVTRDKDFWYFGFHTSMGTLNKTYGLYIDVDNATSGSQYDPIGNQIDTNASHSNYIVDTEFSPNGNLIATASRDKMAKIWSKDGDLLFDLFGHLSAPHSVAWSPDSSVLATAETNSVRIWDPGSGIQTMEIPIPESTVAGSRALLSFSQNGTWIAVGGGITDKVYILDLNDGSVVGFLKPASGFTPKSVAFNPSPAYSDVIAIGSKDRRTYIYRVNATNLNNASGGVPLKILDRAPTDPDGHTQMVQSVCWSPDGTRLVTSAAETTYNVKVWDVWGTNPVVNLTGLFADVRNVHWTGDKIAAGDLDGLVKVWQEVGPSFTEVFSQQAHEAQINGISLSPTDNRMTTVADDTQLRLWNIGTQSLERIFIHKLPDFAIYANYTSVLWGFDEDGFPWSENDTFMNATLYVWNGSAWHGSRLIDIGGIQKYKSLKSGEAVISGFFEMAVPRNALGDPPGFAVELFSVGKNGSHPHDSAPTDINIPNGVINWQNTTRSLSNFVYRRIQIYKVNLSPENATKSVYHFGNHPGENLVKRFGTIGVLVVDNRTQGVYERVYVDLNNDKVFDDADVVLYRGNEVGYVDNFNSTAAYRGDVQNYSTPDGVPDMSAGMLYFISDGVTPIPYSNVYCERNLIEDCIIPKNGELVAFAGELRLQKYHGTRMASAIVGQGKLDTDLDNPDIGQVLGVAPDAKIIMIPNAFSNIFESWYFAVEGYDGIGDTGDEADIVVNGFNFAMMVNDGWDMYSRFADYATTVRSKGSTVFVAGAGNDGFGYGTTNSPASAPGVIAVGVATDFTRDSELYSSYGGKEGSNPKWGDVMPYSSRGPTPMGIPKPDIIAIGEANVDDPLWRVDDGSNATALVSGIFEGSDVSAAITGGVLALIFEAFNSSHQRFPTIEEAKAILRSSADDVNNDVLAQGAGFMNASRAVDLAAKLGGINVDQDYWVPGSYGGSTPEAFAKLMFPGESDSADLTIENTDQASPVTVQASDAILRKTATYYTDGVTKRDIWYSTDRRLTFWINESGLYKIIPHPFIMNNYTIVQTPIDSALWNSAELLKVTAWANFTEIDTDHDGKILRESMDPVMMLELRDWENLDGVPPMDLDYPHTVWQSIETNTFTRCTNIANVLEASVHDPASRTHDALLFMLRPHPNKDEKDLYWRLKIEFYERFDWDWLSVDSTLFTVPAGGSFDLTATVSLPPDVGIGSYEGGIYLTANGNTTVIPVLINVASRETRFTFGGFSPVSQDLYNNTRMGGGMGGGFEGDLEKSGDWRYFFIDVPYQGKFMDPFNFKFYIDVSWSFKPTDINIYAFGSGPAPPRGDYEESRYGKYTLSETGATEDSDEFKTVTNSSQEILTPPLKSGLNVIALRCVMFNGSLPQENVSGTVGWVEITPVELRKVTNQLAGEARLNFVSNFDWPGGMETNAVGPAQMEKFDNVEIWLDKKVVDEYLARERTFVEALADGNYTYVVRVKNALIFDVHIWGKDDSPDLDLGIFLDSNGNRKAEPGEFVEYDADADADEHVKLKAPKDGQYLVKVLGFDTREPGHFDIEISVTIAGVEGYKMVDAPQGPITANTVLSFGMTWEFKGDAEDRDYGGVLTLGPPGAPEAILIPVTITLDRESPAIENLVIASGGKQVNYLDNRTTNQVKPEFSVSVTDLKRGELAPELCKAYFDGVDVTPWSTIYISFDRDAEGVYGYWAGEIVYSPIAPISEGVHNITFVAGDLAGNKNIKDFIIVIDTQSPPLVLDQAAVVYTTSDVRKISGTTEPAATVFIRSENLTADENGRFKTTVSLVNGTNVIPVKVVDWFGMGASGNLVSANDNLVTIEIVHDPVPPTIERIDFLSITNEEFAAIGGLVDDFVSLSPEERLDMTMLSLQVYGVDVPVQSDGSFLAVVPL